MVYYLFWGLIRNVVKSNHLAWSLPQNSCWALQVSYPFECCSGECCSSDSPGAICLLYLFCLGWRLEAFLWCPNHLSTVLALSIFCCLKTKIRFWNLNFNSETDTNYIFSWAFLSNLGWYSQIYFETSQRSLNIWVMGADRLSCHRTT